MASDLSARGLQPAGPPTSAHKMIGTLNVLFAGVLLLCGTCSGIGIVMQVAMAPLSEGYQKAMEEAMTAQRQQERQKKIDELEEQEDAAATEEEKSRLAAQRKALEDAPAPEIPLTEMTAIYRAPEFVGYVVGDFVTAILLNILLFASGIGLLAAKAWGRRLGLWVAALKIVRLLAVYGFAIFFVVPVFSQKMGQMMDKVMTQVPQQPGQPPLPPMGQTVAAFYGIAMSSGAVLMILFGAIYPIVMLWVLTRPKVKAACGEAVAAGLAESP